jgi:predicted CoA-binding protein
LSPQSDVPDLANTSISVIVNPKLTLAMLQKLFSKDPTTFPRAIWLQPGTEDVHVQEFVKEKKIQDRMVMGGACILVSGDGVRQELGADGKGKL